ncbi:helix-turn-helix transcriptional regulator [Metabacillus niabensis]|uniref:helix-turn-helix transcriptional regulator n=1 Tax=Metabacillus niabensis TaxID=324854 RepID=UPI0039A31DEA
MSNWAEDMLQSVEKDIEGLIELENSCTDEKKEEQYRRMRKGLEKQLLDLYRHAVKEGTPFDEQRLSNYEKFHRPKKLYLSDPQLEERHISPLMKTKSAEEELILIETNRTSKEDNDNNIDLSFLTKRQRETIMLYANGLTYSAIAEMLNVKKGTVSKHLQLARNKAKEDFIYNHQMELKLEDDCLLQSKKQTIINRRKRNNEKVKIEQIELKLNVRSRKISK